MYMNKGSNHRFKIKLFQPKHCLANKHLVKYFVGAQWEQLDRLCKYTQRFSKTWG